MRYIIKVNDKAKELARSTEAKEYLIAQLKRKYKQAKITVEKV